MKTKLTITFLILLVIWGVYDVAQHYKTQIGIKVGNRSPTITLKNVNGQRSKLTDFKGDIVIVNFWATWCTPCQNELPVLNKFYNEHKKQKTVILGINATSTEKDQQHVITFSKNNRINYPILLDTKGRYSDLFQVKGYPTTYFIDSRGIIKKIYVGQITAKKLKSILSTIQ
ncbi:TlpA disulfide reductase family protein [Pullulanibacillus sp. KACC 23026]|uniref:TlpA disulfide reductase family protein n=1 Tax=Pullulanibacillus sp. KACC 23026 TaxID=3028315 RepID=UPI0023B172C5|nr:TlpA disulfide reductase family protein [Pullulanibacillus sp. KACC 23026]WEG13662.1 TlpA disulfide reductase family protein [Pullulanibacillus sp. KACC 23026]